MRTGATAHWTRRAASPRACPADADGRAPRPRPHSVLLRQGNVAHTAWQPRPCARRPSLRSVHDLWHHLVLDARGDCVPCYLRVCADSSNLDVPSLIARLFQRCARDGAACERAPHGWLCAAADDSTRRASPSDTGRGTRMAPAPASPACRISLSGCTSGCAGAQPPRTRGEAAVRTPQPTAGACDCPTDALLSTTPWSPADRAGRCSWA